MKIQCLLECLMLLSNRKYSDWVDFVILKEVF